MGDLKWVLEVAHELDQALFFREHADQIWLVLSGQFQVQVDKITGNIPFCRKYHHLPNVSPI